MGLPVIILPVILAIGIALLITGSVFVSKNGYSIDTCVKEPCPYNSKKLTSGSIMLITGSLFLVCAVIGIGFEYRTTGKVSELFSMRDM
ncbi:MAG: hypothetical protein PHG66_01665 [Candidatus Colwellbacteria bacterium]|nr:hypothetical protein [Candidatus Colwellbacteria bacterium]